MTVRFSIRRWWNQALNILYPDGQETCLLCHRPLPNLDEDPQGRTQFFTGSPATESQIKPQANTIPGVCLFCLQDAVTLYQQESSVRNLRVPASHTKPLVHVVPVVAAAIYDGLVRNAIRQWKYDGALEFTHWFGAWVKTSYFEHASLVEQLDMLVPVPSSEDRFRKRGYNHVLLLAHALSPELGLPVQSVLMRRVEPTLPGGDRATGASEFTQSQTAKNARERLQGLQGAYRAHAGVDLTGKGVLLLDDIVTTGATLYTCSQALYAAGAWRVVAMVIAEVK